MSIANAVTEAERDEDPAIRWEPTWVTRVGESEVGAALDDGCVVYLSRNWYDQWVPMTHVPAPAIRFVANLLARAEVTY